MKKAFSIVLVILNCLFFCVYISAFEGVPEAVLSNTPSVFYVESGFGQEVFSGTAFLIFASEENSLLLTNEHVIHENKSSISVWLSENETCAATIKAASEQYDLAVLQVPGKIGAALMFSDNIKQGDAVFAVGFPADANILSDSYAVTSAQATITDGVISAVRSLKLVEYGPSVSILQINADINPGNSGGPLFNSNGEVVGVNTYGVTSASGINGSISTESVISFLKEADYFQKITVAQSQEEKEPDIEPSADIQKDSYFVNKPVPRYLPDVIIGIIILSITAIGISLTVNNRKSAEKDKATIEKTMPLNKYLDALHSVLSCEDIASLLVPVAKEIRNKHTDGTLVAHLSPASVIVGRSGCSISDSSGNTDYDPAFMAPEQLSGGIASIKTDIYAFCHLMEYLYQHGRSLRADDDFANTQIHAANAEKVFLQIIKKGTAFNPEERFASMQDVLFELAALNSGVISESAKAPFTSALRAASGKKHSRIPALVCAIALVLIGGAVIANQVAAARMMDKYAKENDPEKLYFWSVQSIFGNTSAYKEYARAGYYYNKQDYEHASLEYKKLGDFYDSETLYQECRYCIGERLLEQQKYDEAQSVFSELDKYKDSYDKEFEITYQRAEALVAAGDYDAGIELFQSIIDYKDSAERITSASYRKAGVLANNGEYDEAIAIYDSIKDYKDSAELINSTKFRRGYSYLTSQRYQYAVGEFKKLKNAGYLGADEALNEAYYAWAVDFINKKDYVGAYRKLQECKNYEAADVLLDDVILTIYSDGIKKYRNGDFFECLKVFTEIKSYYQADDYSYLASCHALWVDEQAIDRLTNLIGFEDAGALIFQNNNAFFFMEGGTWYGKNGNLRFYKDGNSKWCDYDMELPSGNWEFKDNMFLINDVAYLYILATSRDTILVQYLESGQEYTMTRR